MYHRECLSADSSVASCSAALARRGAASWGGCHTGTAVIQERRHKKTRVLTYVLEEVTDWNDRNIDNNNKIYIILYIIMMN